MYSLCCHVARCIGRCEFARALPAYHAGRGEIVRAATAYHACRGMAGHSKWQNIKAGKEANDHRRSMQFQQYIREIRLAVEAAGGNIKPETNPKLADVLKRCKAIDMPKATIERAIANSIKKKAAGKPIQFEYIGPENSAFLIDCVTEQKNLKERVVNNVFARLGTGMPRPGVADEYFDFFCYINTAPLSESQTVDDALEHAIEVAANDVTEEEEDGAKVWRFECEPMYFDGVLKSLEKLQYTIKDNHPALFVPKSIVELSPDSLKPMLKTLDKLNSMDFIVNVHHNVSNLDS